MKSGREVLCQRKKNLNALSNKTEIILVRENLPSEKSIEGHKYGWNNSMENLANLNIRTGTTIRLLSLEEPTRK